MEHRVMWEHGQRLYGDTAQVQKAMGAALLK
jgi:hypothetical protein